MRAGGRLRDRRLEGKRMRGLEGSADPPAIARPVRLAGAWQAGGHERAGCADLRRLHKLREKGRGRLKDRKLEDEMLRRLETEKG